jgi:transposase
MNSSNIQFLTVSEVQEKTGKSQSTINRIISKYKGSKHVKSDGKKHLISSKLLSELFTNYSFASHLTSKTSKMTSQMNSKIDGLLEAKNETIEILKNELGKKDQVINNQSGQINELIQRNRESNIIIKSLQEQLKLPEMAQTITSVNTKTERHTNTPLIMDLYAQGVKYSEIAERLNARGLKNQYGKQYTREAIKTTVNRNKQ